MSTFLGRPVVGTPLHQDLVDRLTLVEQNLRATHARLAPIDQLTGAPQSFEDWAGLKENPTCTGGGLHRTGRAIDLDVNRNPYIATRTGTSFGGENPGPNGVVLTSFQRSQVVAIPCKQELPTAAGKRRADVLARLVPKTAWQRRSCGDGAKGPRLYDWALVDAGEHHSLLIRRSLTPNAKGVREIAYFLCHTPDPVPLDVLVRVAGSRWAVEECFQAAKNEVGLDHYQVRKYDAWYRHITLAMLAQAFLAVTAKTEKGLCRPR